MRVDFQSGKFVVSCKFEERHPFLEAGFLFDKSVKKLATESIAVALKFGHLLTDAAKSFIGISTVNQLSTSVQDHGWDFMDFQTEGIEYGVNKGVVLIGDEPGLGKGHPLGTHIATPLGWKAIEDLEVGDSVIGSTGEAIWITGVHPRGIQPIFRVTFDDGAHVVVDADHIWSVYDEQGEIRDTNTSDLKEVVDAGSCPEIPVVSSPVKFYSKDLPDPTVAAISRMLPSTYDEPLEIDCREFITASVSQRFDFLSALIRRVGKIRNGAIRIDIPHPWEREDLVDAVVQITRSLGGIAYLETKLTRARIKLHLPEGLWKGMFGYREDAKRIRKKVRKFIPGNPARRIIDVSAVGVDRCICLSVSARDGLYVTEDFILTHNTVQAIGIANRMNGIGSILVICLASHKEHWKRAFETWDINDLSVDIAYGNEPFPDSQVVVCNYDIIHRFHDEVRAGTWDLIICDEAHALKNKEARRTIYTLGGVEKIPSKKWVKGKPKTSTVTPIKARRTIFLSGTPMAGRPRDLFTMIRAADPKGIGADYEAYAKRYCGGYYDTMGGFDDSGATNEDELNAVLRSLLMIRHLKNDVLKDLPPKTRSVVPLSSEGLSRKLEAERDAIVELLSAYERKIGTIKELSEEDIAELVLSATPKMFEDYAEQADDYNISDTPINKLALARQELALAKVPLIVEHIKSLLESEPCIVFFGYHQAVIEAVRDAFPGCACVYGKTPMKKRQSIVDRFQEDETCRVFVGQYTAAGTGFTLTRSRVVVCGELTWVPSELTQAEDRCHRYPQKDNVLVYHLVVVGSLDDYLIKRIIEKQETNDRVLDGKES